MTQRICSNTIFGVGLNNLMLAHTNFSNCSLFARTLFWLPLLEQVELRIIVIVIEWLLLSLNAELINFIYFGRAASTHTHQSSGLAKKLGGGTEIENFKYVYQVCM